MGRRYAWLKIVAPAKIFSDVLATVLGLLV